MTTERRSGLVRRLARGTAVLGGLIVSWFGAMASVMLLTEAAPAAIAIVPDTRAIGRIGPDTKLLRGGPNVLVLTSDEPGYVRRLYQAGAWIVLPALKNGCLDLRDYQLVVLNRGAG